MEAEETVLVYHLDHVVVPPAVTEAASEVISANVGPDPKLRNQIVFSNELPQLWHSKEFMDVDLVCAGNQVVRAHRLVLAALSPFFRRIFSEVGPSPENDTPIFLAEVEATPLKSCLEKVYLGDSSVAVIDKTIEHLAFTGEPLKESPASDSGLHLIQTAIKCEQNDYDELVTSSDKARALTIIPTSSKKAKVWRYFSVQDRESASCKLCQTSIRTKNGCTSGMTRHIARAHPEEQPEIAELKEEPMEFQDDYDMSPGTYDEPAATEAEMPTAAATAKTKKSKVWNFFDRLEKDIAKCKACDMIIKTQKGNTTGMTRHLFRAHMDLYTQLEALREKDIDRSDAGESADGGEDGDDDDFSPFKGLAVRGNSAKKKRRKKSSAPNALKAEENSAGGGDKQPHSGVRNSPVWQFYEELGSNRVKCMKCEVILKYYYGTTSGLLRHLRRSHPEAYECIKNDENTTTTPQSVSDAVSGALEVDNETIWKFFIKAEEGSKANCGDCMAEIPNEHGSLVTSCEEHLRGSHTDLLEQYESQRKAYVQELIKNDKTAIKRRYTSRVVASAIWSYFKKTDDSALNQCLTCLVEIDCSQNTTAMVRHLEEAHPEQHDAFKKQSGIEAKDIKKPSAIWKHFQTTDDPKKHRCLVS